LDALPFLRSVVVFCGAGEPPLPFAILFPAFLIASS
jgi:hypothetical protein